jgi:hypothetical protein
MSGMDDLVTWLRAQLDEDERVARSAASFPYQAPSNAPWERERIIAERVGGRSRAVATHRIVATFANPARVLAEVDAKRRILDEAIRLESYDSEFQFLELLALPYADRPGYLEEWRA